MKTEKNIFIAFILNLMFSIFELFGGMVTGSVAILSDALHDFGDAISIGFSFALEKISKKNADKKYTYGYAGYSILGGLITTLVLIIGACVVIYNAVMRFINPTPLDYDGMIIIAIVGVVVNVVAAYFTHGGKSVNQKAVNLHMIEDVLGWIVVLIGALIIKFTGIDFIDSIMSIIVSIFIAFGAVKNLRPVLNVLLSKIPDGIDLVKIKNDLINVSGVLSLHHLHVWTFDGENVCMTMHVVVEKYEKEIKLEIKEKLKELNVFHSVIEFEVEGEDCEDINCNNPKSNALCHHGHSHHGHSHHGHCHHEHSR